MSRQAKDTDARFDRAREKAEKKIRESDLSPAQKRVARKKVDAAIRAARGRFGTFLRGKE